MIRAWMYYLKIWEYGCQKLTACYVPSWKLYCTDVVINSINRAFVIYKEIFYDYSYCKCLRLPKLKAVLIYFRWKVLMVLCFLLGNVLLESVFLFNFFFFKNILRRNFFSHSLQTSCCFYPLFIAPAHPHTTTTLTSVHPIPRTGISRFTNRV